MITTDNPHGGFFGTIAARQGEETAKAEWPKAVAAITQFLEARGRKVPAEDIRRFLDSEFGVHAARDVLDKTPVWRQLQNRASRFLKHFETVQRRPVES